MNKKAVFTCVTGGYDFVFPPQNVTEGWDYICFTENENFEASGWKMIPFEGTMSKVRLARYVKILQPELDNYDLTVWMDANFVVTCNIDEHVRRNHKEGYYTVMKHPNRKCFYEECKAVIKKEKSMVEMVLEQALAYQAQGLPRGNGLIASGIIIRDNSPETKKVNQAWWEQVKMFSDRDQLAFCHVLWKNQVKINYSGYNYLSETDFMLKSHVKNQK